jgi:hypothetical protein
MGCDAEAGMAKATQDAATRAELRKHRTRCENNGASLWSLQPDSSENSGRNYTTDWDSTVGLHDSDPPKQHRPIKSAQSLRLKDDLFLYCRNIAVTLIDRSKRVMVLFSTMVGEVMDSRARTHLSVAALGNENPAMRHDCNGGVTGLLFSFSPKVRYDSLRYGRRERDFPLGVYTDHDHHFCFRYPRSYTPIARPKAGCRGPKLEDKKSGANIGVCVLDEDFRPDALVRMAPTGFDLPPGTATHRTENVLLLRSGWWWSLIS